MVAEKVEAYSNLHLEDGVSVVGHSMGGQATLFSSAYNSTSHNIVAAVYHHAWTEDFPAPQIPFLDFTSVWDDEAPADTMGQVIYDIPDTPTKLSKGLVSTKNFGHHEADILGFNPLLPQFTAAWLKIFMDGTFEETQNGVTVNWEGMIFGDDVTSVCGGGMGDIDPDMCEIVDMR